MAKSTMMLAYKDEGITGEQLMEFARIIPQDAIVKVWVEEERDYSAFKGTSKTTKMQATWGD